MTATVAVSRRAGLFTHGGLRSPLPVTYAKPSSYWKLDGIVTRSMDNSVSALQYTNTKTVLSNDMMCYSLLTAWLSLSQAQR